MMKNCIAILVTAIFLLTITSLWAGEECEDSKATLHKEQITNEKCPHQENCPLASNPSQPPKVKKPPQPRIERQMPRIERQLQAVTPPRLAPNRPMAQLFDRWFNALKQAYRENDREKIGQLIRKMQQLKNTQPEQLKAIQPLRPQVQQRLRQLQARQQAPIRRQQMQQRRMRQQLLDEKAPALRRQAMRRQRWQQTPIEQERPALRRRDPIPQQRMRMQGMPDQPQKPRAARQPARARGFCENCTCEKCEQLRTRMRRRQQRTEGRMPQPQPRPQRMPQRETIPEHQESDFDWDW